MCGIYNWGLLQQLRFIDCTFLANASSHNFPFNHEQNTKYLKNANTKTIKSERLAQVRDWCILCKQ